MLLSALLLAVLDLLHFLKVLVVDPVVWLISLVWRSDDALLRRYYAGKTVVVTGASSGLGEAFALQLARLHANLVLTARNTASLERIAKECRTVSEGRSQVVVLPLDLETVANQDQDRREELDKYIQGLSTWLSQNSIAPPHVLINNAGVSSRGAALDTEPATLRKVMNTNFFGPAAFTRALLPVMSKGGAIGVVSSVQGRLGIALRTSYAASKHALQGWFDSLRAELGSQFSVTVISPGYISTNLSNNAITPDGSLYGKTDETTAKGMSPGVCARASLVAIARGVSDLVLADAKVQAAVQAKAQFPGLLAKATKSKSTTKKS
jgi:short-subunit dehydrogenase